MPVAYDDESYPANLGGIFDGMLFYSASIAYFLPLLEICTDNSKQNYAHQFKNIMIKTDSEV